MPVAIQKQERPVVSKRLAFTKAGQHPPKIQF